MLHNLSNCGSDKTIKPSVKTALESQERGYRAWEGLHRPPPPPLLPSGSPSASLWGRWEDSGAWHESTRPRVWDIQCCKHFIFLSHTKTLETSSSHGMDKTNRDLHLPRCSYAPAETDWLWIRFQKLIQGNFLSCLPGGHTENGSTDEEDSTMTCKMRQGFMTGN